VTDVTGEALTIDEVARRVGMTARNVRAHQSRGLIEPPILKGRTGYYGPEHVARLEMIRDLQDQGFNLEAIKRLLENAPVGSPAEVFDFTRALVAPFGDERPRVVEEKDFIKRWGGALTSDLAERALSLGVVRDLGDGTYEIRSPRLVRAAEELADLGVPLEVTIEVTAALKRHSEAVAAAYVSLFLDHVWRPFQERGEPADEWPGVREALERLRPLAGESLHSMFGLVMTDAVEEAFEREVEARSERRAGPSAAA
jgi:DNA-binding transcriptional MerR regulator